MDTVAALDLVEEGPSALLVAIARAIRPDDVAAAPFRALDLRGAMCNVIQRDPELYEDGLRRYRELFMPGLVVLGRVACDVIECSRRPQSYSGVECIQPVVDLLLRPIKLIRVLQHPVLIRPLNNISGNIIPIVISGHPVDGDPDAKRHFNTVRWESPLVHQPLQEERRPVVEAITPIVRPSGSLPGHNASRVVSPSPHGSGQPQRSQGPQRSRGPQRSQGTKCHLRVNAYKYLPSWRQSQGNGR